MGQAQFVEFAIPSRIDFTSLAAALPGTLTRTDLAQRTLTYYDTFDWRLYRAGIVLVTATDGGDTRLICRRRVKGKTLIIADTADSVPRFATEIRDERLRALLAPELEMRALLPQLVVDCQGCAYRSQQEALSLFLFRGELPAAADSPAHPLGQWLEVDASGDGLMRMDALGRRLAEEFSLDAGDVSLLLCGLSAAGKCPDDPTPTPVRLPDPLQRADVATKAVLLGLMAVMEINQAGILARLDSEFLHDFRVAVRRTRSALGQIKAVFPPRTVAGYASAFAWLGQITGPARDLDVYLLGFNDLRAQIPAALGPALDPLRALLAARADRAYGELIRQLHSARYRKLMASWSRFLQAPPVKRPSAPNALLPIAELADQRILKVFRRVLKQGKAIRDDSPDEQLHQLRKTCKKLRYLLEFFQSLYPEEKIKSLIKRLKGFQNHLGELQDLSTQIQTLYDLSQEIRSMKAIPAETLLAMGALLAQLDTRRRAQRESFKKSFQDFSDAENQAHYRRLFTRRTLPMP